MAEQTHLAAWWKSEMQRDFTKLEYTLLGGLFTAIAIIFMLVIRLSVG